MLLSRGQNVFCVLIFCAAICQIYSQFPSNTAQDRNIQQLTGSEPFGLELFKRMAKELERTDYDFMISPFSIWTLLLLTAEGAFGNTLSELQKTLKLNQDFQTLRENFSRVQSTLSVNSSTIEVAAFQAIFPDSNKPINTEYLDTLQKFYSTDLVATNYQDKKSAQRKINGYVSKATKGRINYVVNEQDLFNAHLILISTIYFRAQWKFPFNRTLTKEETFYNEVGAQSSSVNMMYVKGPFPYTAINQIDSHVLELPYGKDDRLVMIIFLPKRGVPLINVIDRIAAVGISFISNELERAGQEYEDDEVEVFLPRFSTVTDVQLNKPLQEMGIIDAFEADKAKFPKISDLPLHVSSLFHKTKIEVTEEGTVASAVTAGIFANKATPPRFYVNRPFAYIIFEKRSKSLLFCGQVRKPERF